MCATRLLDILGLVLKIVCEAWLDHIYVKRIRFSRTGAMNLMRDFDGVASWIDACADLLPAHRPVLGRHEVLRMCEGVAKILLRKPDDVISMVQERLQRPAAGKAAEGKTILCNWQHTARAIYDEHACLFVVHVEQMPAQTTKAPPNCRPRCSCPTSSGGWNCAPAIAM